MKILSEDAFLKIETLANDAIYAQTKADAKQYIRQLELLQQTTDYDGNIREIFGQVVAYVESAAGQVENKEFYVSIVEEELSKLHGKVQRAEE